MSQPLVNAGPGGVIEAGIAPSRHKESVEFWHDGENVSFRNLGVEKALGSEEQITVNDTVIRVAQAYLPDGTKRIYYQDSIFRVWGWNGSGFPYLIGQLAGPAQLEPYGSWLLAAQNGLWLWKNGGALALVADAPVGIKHLTKNSKHLLGATDNTLAWAHVKNIEEWTASRQNTARSLPFRDLDSAIQAVSSLAGQVAVYTKDSCRLVAYNGAGFWFGEREPLNGIGAVGPNSIISAGFKNYGISLNGIFVTDGSQFTYIDTPAFHGYFKILDWTRSSEIFGYHNESFGEVVWFFPCLDGEFRGIGYKYTNGGFTRYKLPYRSAAERQVFDYPIFGTTTGVSFGKGRTTEDAFVRTKPLDGGNSLFYKFWDHYRFVGEFSDAIVRLGASDEVNEEPEWFYEGPLENSIYYLRECVFLTIELAAEGEAWFEISQILATGESGGAVL